MSQNLTANRFLTLAEKVLEDERVLTGSQVWDVARQLGYVALDQSWGRSPAVAMALTLAAESQRPGSEIQRIESDAPTYCLRYVWLMTLPLDAALAAVYADADRIAQTMSFEEIKARAIERGAKIAARAQRYSKQGRAAILGRERNPFIIAGVRKRADYCCELCGERGFEREEGKLPYVEVHHLTRLADGGPDTFENTAALCANCHRKMHFAGNRQGLREVLVANLQQKGVAVVAP